MFDAADTVGKSLRILEGVICTLTVRVLPFFPFRVRLLYNWIEWREPLLIKDNFDIVARFSLRK